MSLFRRVLNATFVLLVAGPVAGQVTPGTTSGPTTTLRPPTEVEVPASIDATGDTDVTDAMRAFLASIPDRAVIQFPPRARYRVEDTLALDERYGLTFEGNGATFFATTPGGPERSHWLLSGGAQLVFRDLIIRGPRPGDGEPGTVDDRPGQHAFRIDGSYGVELDDVEVSDIYGDFVHLARGEDELAAESVWVHDSRFERNGGNGFVAESARNIVIEQNSIDATGGTTIDLEPNSNVWGVQNVHIIDNRVAAGGSLFLSSYGNGPVEDVVVSGNRLSDLVLGIDVKPPKNDRRARFYILDNTSDTQAETAPLRFTQVDGIVIRDNEQPVSSPDEPGILTQDVCGIAVKNNDFGRATKAVEVEGEACDGLAAPVDLPPVPAIAGGDGDRRPALGSTPTTIAVAHDGGGASSWRFVVWAAGALAALGAALYLARYITQALARRPIP
jgi:hypothetical protein